MFILLTEMPELPKIGETEEIPQAEAISDTLSEIFKTNIKSSTVDFLIKLLFAAVVFVIGVYVIKLIRKLLVKYLDRSSVPIDNISFIDSIVKILLYLVLIMIIAGNFGIQATSILALIGSAGLTIGLAFQGALSNFAGGILILMTKPFALGDYIIADGSHEGTVVDIAIVHTKLRTVDNRIIIIPNGELAKTTLINTTAERMRKIEILIGISYNEDIDRVRAVINDVLQKDGDVKKDEDIKIFVNKFCNSSVEIGIRVMVDTEKYFETKWRLNENLKKAFDGNGIEIPFDQIDVHIKNDISQEPHQVSS